jgi:superfamily II DNA or RNA helicase
VQLPPAALPGIRPHPSFRFRAGQQAFLEKLAAAFEQGDTAHMGVFVPGYGKTITALASFVIARAMGVADRVVIFVPRGNLRDQYADAEELARVFEFLGAGSFSFCVADSDAVFLKNLRTQIIVTTYQYASGKGGRKALEKFCAQSRCLFVFDEVHHLSEDGTWAQALDTLDCAASVSLSGTPMRSDNKTLFGVPFEMREDGEQYYVALHEVTLRDAHAEGAILKQVAAHVVDYRLKMVRGDTGEEVEFSLAGLREFGASSKEIDTFLARRRLRFHDVYLETLLDPAFDRFAEKRHALGEEAKAIGMPRSILSDHQMLIIAMSNRHAAAILAFVQSRYPQFTSARIGQDLPASDCRRDLDAFRNGEIDVMVQVDMIGEGTDIKPISIIVKADLVRAYSKTLQQVFRGMRFFPAWSEAANVCDIYTANDSDVVDVLDWITSEEQIGIKTRPKQTGREGAAPTKESSHSHWELAHVEQSAMKSHALAMEDSAGPHDRVLRMREMPKAGVVDVAAREKSLRRACSDLATELYHTLQSAGRPADIREIHAAAKRYVGAAQGKLSLPELEQKQRWLRRCLQMRRLA